MIGWLGWVVLDWDVIFLPRVWYGVVVWCLKRERGAGERERRMYVCMYTRF